MIDLSGLISMDYLMKSRFTGSFKGMRYALHQKTEAEGEVVLEAVVWPEPYNYDVTPQEKKHAECFPFSHEGLDQAVSWLNQRYQGKEF